MFRSNSQVTEQTDQGHLFLLKRLKKLPLYKDSHINRAFHLFHAVCLKKKKKKTPDKSNSSDTINLSLMARDYI